MLSVASNRQVWSSLLLRSVLNFAVDGALPQCRWLSAEVTLNLAPGDGAQERPLISDVFEDQSGLLGACVALVLLSLRHQEVVAA